MTLKSDAKFKEKLTCGFKYDTRVHFHSTTQKSEKFGLLSGLFFEWNHFDGLFLSNVCEVWTKKTQRSYLSWNWTVMHNLNKPWPCGFKTGMRNWVNFHYSAQKSEKLYIDGLFLSKGYMFQLENFRGIMCHDTEGWCKI